MRHASSEAHVVQLTAHRTQAGFDVAQTFAVGQLSKSHRQILVAAREASMVGIAAITLDTFLEFVGGQVIHELGRRLSVLHSFLIVGNTRRWLPISANPRLCAVNSNRKIRLRTYLM